MCDKDQLTSYADERRRRALIAITELSSDPCLSIQDIAAVTAVSRSELYRLFKTDGGIKRYLIQHRLAGMREALMQPDDKRTFGRIAKAYGFKNAYHASRSFKTAYGIPPSHFRRQHCGNLSHAPSLSTEHSESLET